VGAVQWLSEAALLSYEDEYGSDDYFVDLGFYGDTAVVLDAISVGYSRCGV
jgi:hypothetical protein